MHGAKPISLFVCTNEIACLKGFLGNSSSLTKGKDAEEKNPFCSCLASSCMGCSCLGMRCWELQQQGCKCERRPERKILDDAVDHYAAASELLIK